MVKLVKEIDGKEYIYEVGRNYIIMEAIKGDKGHYKIGHKYDGITSTIYFKSNNYLDNEPKIIGQLLYDFDTDIITYRKYIKQATHEYHKTNSLGLNWEIVSNLCPKDYIKIIVDTGDKKIVHTISVSKALKFQDFRYYKMQGYEKQIFIPIEEFRQKELEQKKKRRGRKSGNATNEKRKKSA